MPLLQLLRRSTLLAGSFVLAGHTCAVANTVAQNVAWTIDRPETETKYRIVAYGDSIFSGYKGSISNVAIWAGPTVDGEYASNFWGTDIETIRRTKAGAKAGDVYRNKIVDDASYMQTDDTRVVAFTMCGNDALNARNDFSGQEGTCDLSRLQAALNKCTTFLQRAMIFINDNAGLNVERKVVSNLYYAGYDTDDVPSDCTDEGTGEPLNKQDTFLPYVLRMNWRACNFAREYGFRCADNFATFMGADYDSNSDGRKDSRALRYRRGESEDAYVERLSVTLRSTIRDANMKFLGSMTTYDYIQSDDTHPTYEGDTVSLGTLGGSGGGTSPPRFDPEQYNGKRNPIFRKFGHERIGHSLARFNPVTP